VLTLCIPYFVGSQLLTDVARLRNPFEYYRAYKQKRGMSVVRDWIDWLGGYPFEVASATEIFDFMRARGFRLDRLISTNGSGCNEFVFRREALE
jgi:hypothetical protein